MERRPEVRTYLVIAAVVLALVVAGVLALGDRPPKEPAVSTGAPGSAPASSAEGTAAVYVAAKGIALPTITTAPPGTFAMADSSKLGADARYKITFSPFGYGPASGAPTYVIHVAEAMPDNESARAMAFTDRNMLVYLGVGESAIDVGGEYAATLGFREQGSLVVPVLSDVQVVE